MLPCPEGGSGQDADLLIYLPPCGVHLQGVPVTELVPAGQGAARGRAPGATAEFFMVRRHRIDPVWSTAAGGAAQGAVAPREEIKYHCRMNELGQPS